MQASWSRSRSSPAATAATTSTSAAAPTTTAAASTGKATAEVKLADSDLGQILVEAAAERTLYLFKDHPAGDASTCSGACAAGLAPADDPEGHDRWPRGGVDSDELTTLPPPATAPPRSPTTRTRSTTTPATATPGDASGNDLDQFGAEWYAMNAAGDSAGDSDSSEDSTTSSGGSGYSY